MRSATTRERFASYSVAAWASARAAWASAWAAWEARAAREAWTSSISWSWMMRLSQNEKYASLWASDRLLMERCLSRSGRDMMRLYSSLSWITLSISECKKHHILFALVLSLFLHEPLLSHGIGFFLSFLGAWCFCEEMEVVELR